MANVVSAGSIDEILKTLSDERLVARLFMSSTAFLLSDWLFTLDMEIQYAWRGPWNTGRILFFLTRYSAFLETGLKMYFEVAYSIPVSLCSLLYLATASLSIFGIVVAEVILVIRVWALWERRRCIGILLVLVSTINCLAAVLTYALYAPSYAFIPMDSISPTMPGCFLVGSGATTNWAYIPLLVQQTFIFTLTVIRGYQHHLTGGYGTSLVKTLYQDGLIYYVLLIVPSIITLSVTFPKINATYTGLLLSLQRVLHSALSARMLLHLRHEADRLAGNITTITDLQFATVESLSNDLPRHDADLVREGPHGGWFGTS